MQLKQVTEMFTKSVQSGVTVLLTDPRIHRIFNALSDQLHKVFTVEDLKYFNNRNYL